MADDGFTPINDGFVPLGPQKKKVIPAVWPAADLRKAEANQDAVRAQSFNEDEANTPTNDKVAHAVMGAIESIPTSSIADEAAGIANTVPDWAKPLLAVPGVGAAVASNALAVDKLRGTHLYEQGRDAQREASAEADADPLADLGRGLGTVAQIPTALATGAETAGAKGLSTLGKMAKAAKIGGAIGAAQGFGEGEGAADSLKKAALGGAAGAALAGGLAGAADVAGKVPVGVLNPDLGDLASRAADAAAKVAPNAGKSLGAAVGLVKGGPVGAYFGFKGGEKVGDVAAKGLSKFADLVRPSAEPETAIPVWMQSLAHDVGGDADAASGLDLARDVVPAEMKPAIVAGKPITFTAPVEADGTMPVSDADILEAKGVHAPIEVAPEDPLERFLRTSTGVQKSPVYSALDPDAPNAEKSVVAFAAKPTPSVPSPAQVAKADALPRDRGVLLQQLLEANGINDHDSAAADAAYQAWKAGGRRGPKPTSNLGGMLDAFDVSKDGGAPQSLLEAFEKQTRGAHTYRDLQPALDALSDALGVRMHLPDDVIARHISADASRVPSLVAPSPMASEPIDLAKEAEGFDPEGKDWMAWLTRKAAPAPARPELDRAAAVLAQKTGADGAIAYKPEGIGTPPEAHQAALDVLAKADDNEPADIANDLESRDPARELEGLTSKQIARSIVAPSKPALGSPDLKRAVQDGVDRGVPLKQLAKSLGVNQGDIRTWYRSAQLGNLFPRGAQ
jgi:hypothetical protein